MSVLWTLLYVPYTDLSSMPVVRIHGGEKDKIFAVNICVYYDQTAGYVTLTEVVRAVERGRSPKKGQLCEIFKPPLLTQLSNYYVGALDPQESLHVYRLEGSEWVRVGRVQDFLDGTAEILSTASGDQVPVERCDDRWEVRLCFAP